METNGSLSIEDSTNDRLQGDVNLFALAAREFVTHNRLYYPMKFEYSDHVQYHVLQSPASQHPLLWPFVCGLLGKAFHTDDTFLILKVMCEIAGAFLIMIVAYVGIHTGWPNEALVTTCCIALSPMLIDFSANGSPYILSAVMIILAIILLEHFRYQRITDYVLAGILCGIGLQVHMTMICIPVAFSANDVYLFRHRFARPPIQHDVEANLSNRVKLLGYALDKETVRPGESLALTLYWQATAPMETSYTVFAHIIDEGGAIKAQRDGGLGLRFGQ